MELKVGMIVHSKAGHDKNSFYVVCKIEDGFCYIANGKQRKLANPKKKNPLHLAKTNTVIDLADITGEKKLHTLLNRYETGRE